MSTADARKCLGCGQPFQPRKGMYWVEGGGPYHGMCLPRTSESVIADRALAAHQAGLRRAAGIARAEANSTWAGKFIAEKIAAAIEAEIKEKT